MRLLMLGGTGFVGPAVVEAARERSWEVTVLNRGTRGVPEGVRALRGDRTAAGGLDALREGEWDVVVDAWSGAPRAVLDAARLLAGRAGRYAYVSSVSVYGVPAPADKDEATEVVAAAPDAPATDYAADKRGGELAAAAAFGEERALSVRAGLILGPYEDVGRLPWWLGRLARGGPVPAPGPRELPLQYIDVRDLARWTLDALAEGLHGPYNVVSPPGHTTMGELLEACAAVTGGEAELRWAAPEAVEAAGAEPWTELPVWVPPGPLHDTLHRTDVGRAVAAGLRCRPVGETVRDTWAWLQGLGGRAPQRADRSRKGLPPEKEERLLAALAGGGRGSLG
ncbi:NAD-dependent epimerase/dehydratase family protein [Streptomyces sp. JJ36]|uniref:NAD-dependent epimerase/dehydratase family protein n=1 Tax=Streptomyces sp. JJ36 TaxID=2736645 RepID=UPI001F02722B|nr:NAD-dependent epimerase/dehydratase family protein [Streptomyces sp. JJ36]MCF6526244.1 NAD-dependent epimerase/dehydratase family protein [Streptomyces sp. JJ36]